MSFHFDQIGIEEEIKAQTKDDARKTATDSRSKKKKVMTKSNLNSKTLANLIILKNPQNGFRDF